MRALPLFALGIIGAAEGVAALDRHRARHVLYEQAKQQAADLGRPLVVVGDPDSGAHTSLVRAYGCGDVCIDLRGCGSCPRAITTDITRIIPLPTDSSVVFVSCVLEYVADPQATWAEILRVAGSPDNVFLARVQPWTLTAALYPGARWTIERRDGAIDQTPVTDGRKIASLGVIAALAAWAVWPRRA